MVHELEDFYDDNLALSMLTTTTNATKFAQIFQNLP
jgi:hypothetical protein